MWVKITSCPQPTKPYRIPSTSMFSLLIQYGLAVSGIHQACWALSLCPAPTFTSFRSLISVTSSGALLLTTLRYSLPGPACLVFFPPQHSHPDIIEVFKILPSWLEWRSIVISTYIISFTSLFGGYFLTCKMVISGVKFPLTRMFWGHEFLSGGLPGSQRFLPTYGTERQMGFACFQDPWDFYSAPISAL